MVSAPRAAYLPGMQVTRIAHLDDRALLRVSGPDARAFLHGLLTQDVEGLEAGAVRYGALLSPPGRLLFDLLLWGERDAVILDVAATRRDALQQRLDLYRLRAKVEIAPDPRPVFACWHGDAAGFAADPRLPGLGGRRLGGDLTTNADAGDWNVHRLTLGVPATPDWPDDGVYPIEADFDLLGGIDFRKGCFVGQETTSRMKRRAAVRSRMLPLAFEGPPPPFGTEVLNGDLRAGRVLSGAPGRAIALVRLDRLDGVLTAEGRPVRVEPPDWLG